MRNVICEVDEEEKEGGGERNAVRGSKRERWCDCNFSMSIT